MHSYMTIIDEKNTIIDELEKAVSESVKKKKKKSGQFLPLSSSRFPVHPKLQNEIKAVQLYLSGRNDAGKTDKIL